MAAVFVARNQLGRCQGERRRGGTVVERRGSTQLGMLARTTADNVSGLWSREGASLAPGSRRAGTDDGGAARQHGPRR